MEHVPFPTVLPEVLSTFLAEHPDASAIALAEPDFAPIDVDHPALCDRPLFPNEDSFEATDRLIGLSCLRRARQDGTAHYRITVDEEPARISVVAFIGTPFSVAVIHPDAGIGPVTELPTAHETHTLAGTLDGEFRIDAIEGEVCPFIDCNADELIGTPLSSTMAPGSLGVMMDGLIEAHMLGAASCDVELSNQGDGTLYRLSFFKFGGIIAFSLVERSSVEITASESKRRIQLSDFAESVHQGFFRVSDSGKLLYKNSRLDEIFGRAFHTHENFGDVRTLSGDLLATVVIEELQSKEECVVDVAATVDGQNRTIRVNVRCADGPEERVEYVGSAEDVTEALAREKQLAEEALTDPMTGTANRRGLEIVVDRQLAADPFVPFAVLLCDLDGFKQVNDSLGHDAGDLVIAEVGNRLRDVSREPDLVARMGGDEFVVVANNINGHDEAMEFAERILPWLRQPYTIDDSQIELSGSVGVALATPGMSTHNLLQMADHAMYEAKRAGRNQAVAYHTPDAATTISPLALRRDLRRAISENSLDIAFQPIYAIDNLEHAESAEALLRWEHPIQGRIEPSTMVTIAEQSGLIRDLGEWVITESIRTAASVNANAERQISIAVNVSALQMGRPDFVDMVSASLDFHELDASSLTIELTESYLIDRMDNARQAIDDLVDLGVRLAIDDFGTGYSTFEYLLRLPVYAVKIDPSFTQKLTESRGSAMLRGLCMACRELDMLVVAEGIETVEQLEAARTAGVTHAQGYLLGMPVSTASLGMRANSAARVA